MPRHPPSRARLRPLAEGSTGSRRASHAPSLHSLTRVRGGALKAPRQDGESANPVVCLSEAGGHLQKVVDNGPGGWTGSLGGRMNGSGALEWRRAPLHSCEHLFDYGLMGALTIPQKRSHVRGRTRRLSPPLASGDRQRPGDSGGIMGIDARGTAELSRQPAPRHGAGAGTTAVGTPPGVALRRRSPAYCVA